MVRIHSPLKSTKSLKKNELKILLTKNTQKRCHKKKQKYFPEFGGSTGGWLQAAETEEKYVMTWVNEKKVANDIFEMPTGGAAIMKQGPNLVYFARKEQCLALGKQLRTDFKINDYRVFRLLPSGEVQFIHQKMVCFLKK